MQATPASRTDKLAGGAYIQGSPLEISGSTFRDNSANGYAGLALFGYGGVLEGSIVNSTFVGNTARTGLGGAMSIQAATSLTLENVTIARNTAPCDVCFAAGIANDTGDALTLRNVIFEDNIGGNIYNPWAMLHPAAQGAANISMAAVARQRPERNGGSARHDIRRAQCSPILRTTADPTETMAIAPGSPAIDAGTADRRACDRSARLRRVTAPSTSARTNGRAMRSSAMDSTADRAVSPLQFPQAACDVQTHWPQACSSFQIM